MIRLYQQGDEEKINLLYKKVFNKTRSLAEWKWKFNRFSSPPAIIIIAEENGQIIGHAACLKIEAAYQTQSLILAERVDIMVDPAHQGQGIYKKIVARMLEECEKQNISIIYGFPAPKAKDIFVSTAKASDLGNLPRFLAVNKPGALLKAKLPQLSFISDTVNKLYNWLPKKKSFLRLRELDLADLPLIDELYERYAQYYPLHAKRGSDYIKRRFLEHPVKDYRLYAFNDGVEDRGYAVINRETVANGVCFETIVDLWGPNNNRQLTDMFQAVRQNSTADAINVWAVKDSERYAALKAARFYHINSPMPFVIKSFMPGFSANRMEDWHLSQSDADSY